MSPRKESQIVEILQILARLILKDDLGRYN